MEPTPQSESALRLECAPPRTQPLVVSPLLRPQTGALLLALFLLGCSARTAETPQRRSEAAKTIFEHTSKTFHTPSAEAKEPEKDKLQNEATAGDEELLRKYPEQDYWAAQALRCLGN